MKQKIVNDGFMAEWNDICANRHGGNAESVEADKMTDKHRDRATILAGLQVVPDATCEEISEGLNMRYTTVSARMSELKREGLIEPTVRRKTRSGATAMAWRVKP